MAVQQQITEIDAELPMTDLCDRQHVRFLSDFDVGFRIVVQVVHGVPMRLVSQGFGFGDYRSLRLDHPLKREHDND